MTSKGMKTNRLPPMPEADLQDAVIQLLHFFRFTVAHFRAGRTSWFSVRLCFKRKNSPLLP